MKTIRYSSFARQLSRQHGVVLVVALVFLIILTLVGIGVFSTTTSEELMARNFRDREIALQGAEAALNEAKVFISGSYDSNTGVTPTPPKPLDYKWICYESTLPVAVTCDPALNPVTLDLFSGSVTGAPLGQMDDDFESPISPVIPGFIDDDQPRYLIIWQTPLVCGQPKESERPCYLILAQSRGRMSNTRVNLAEVYLR